MNGSTYVATRNKRSVNIKTFSIFLQQWMMPLTLLVSDILALSFSWTVSFIFANLFGRNLTFSSYVNFLVFIPMFILTYALNNLYSRTAINPIEEMKKLSLLTILANFFVITMIFIFSRESLFVYSRFSIIMACVTSLLLAPLFRSFTRQLFSAKSWWGTPVLILGAGKTGQMIAERISKNPSQGLKVVGILDDDHEKHSFKLDYPATGFLSDIKNIASQNKLCKVLVCMPGVKKERLLSILDECNLYFDHVTIIPDLFGMSSLWVNAKDISGVLALDIQNSSLSTSAQIIKRFMDVFLTATGVVLISPILLAICLLIKMDSSGPIFYGHKRLTKGGKTFKCWKFRSMHINADKMLKEYLDQDPELNKEWEENFKLKNDPRITKIGRFLRKTSLDELPQLWNVLKGELSLVGPRPIVEDEIEKFGKDYILYKRTKPGITGYWQVSGRTDTTYEERTKLERYYVSNWSVWLDIYILAKTFVVVFKKEGAY